MTNVRAPFPPTAAISDALDSLGLPGSVHGIGPLGSGHAIAGPVYNVRYEPVGSDGGTVGDFLDGVDAGSVLLIDNTGRTDCTVWGGIMTRVAAHRGLAGTVINGACRDVVASRDIRYPIWSAGRFMRTGKDRVRLAAVQEDLNIDGVPVHPGDWLFADDDGVVIVPLALKDEVTAAAWAIEDVEAAIVREVEAGSTLADARALLGYHTLQTRRER